MTDSILERKINSWLHPPFDQKTIEAVKKLFLDEQQLKDAFYKDLEFGTGGMRGIMGVGTNRINKYTLGKNTQGLANYLNKQFRNTQIRVVIAYDCRHNSQSLAQIVAEIFSANNIEAFIFKELRPTPQLSFAVKNLKAQCGIVLTASHNPPEYNGYKVYWEDGGQIVPPQDGEIMAAISKLEYSDILFEADQRKIHILDQKIDEAFWQTAVEAASIDQKRKENFKIVFTPLHGTSVTALPQVLAKAGFSNVHIVAAQKTPNGDFPTVTSPNPEEPAALEMALEQAEKIEADIVIGTDPDADRLGIAVRDENQKLVLLNGNQTMLIMTYFLLKRKEENGQINQQQAIASTIVSSPIIRKVARHFGVHLFETLTGFKWIADAIKKNPSLEFIGGGEESYGYMVGSKVRDKDAITASLLICEIGTWCANNKKTIFGLMQECYQTFGFYQERLIALTKKGAEGSEEIDAMMRTYRENPPEAIAGLKVLTIADYKTGIETNRFNGQTTKLKLPQSDVLIFKLENDGQIALRPSGTEPKIKFYLSVNKPYDATLNWNTQVDELEQKLDTIQKALAI